MGVRLAIAGPLQAGVLAEEFGLTPPAGIEIPSGHGGPPITDLVVALRGRVDSLDLVTLDPRLQDPVELRGDRVRLVVGPLRARARTRGRDLFAQERDFIATQLGAWRPDVVSAHWTYEYALGALATGLPTLVTVHDWAPAILKHARDPYRVIRLAMDRLALRRGSHFAAVSPYIAARVERRTGRPVAVLPNIVDSSRCLAPSGSRHRLRALAVNNGFGRGKNVRALLRAWPEVLRVLPDAELVLAGEDFEDGGSAHQWAATRGFDRHVTFSGPQPRSRVANLMSEASVFVHPSREESFGMTVLEAMACATPVVGGRRSGAVPWLLEDGAGVVVDVTSPSRIADAVKILLEDHTLARRVGDRAQTRALDRFSPGPVAAAYMRELDRVAAT